MASSTQIANFLMAYHAFNLMASISQDQSPLKNVLHPDVKVFKVGDDTKTWQSGRDAVIRSFYGLVKNGRSPQFNPYYKGNLPDFSNRDMVKGNGAEWIDTDGSDSDNLSYTFKFNGDLIAEAHAK